MQSWIAGSPRENLSSGGACADPSHRPGDDDH
jgi:hypothetical protein